MEREATSPSPLRRSNPAKKVSSFLSLVSRTRQPKVVVRAAIAAKVNESNTKMIGWI